MYNMNYLKRWCKKWLLNDLRNKDWNFPRFSLHPINLLNFRKSRRVLYTIQITWWSDIYNNRAYEAVDCWTGLCRHNAQNWCSEGGAQEDTSRATIDFHSVKIGITWVPRRKFESNKKKKVKEPNLIFILNLFYDENSQTNSSYQALNVWTPAKTKKFPS